MVQNSMHFYNETIKRSNGGLQLVIGSAGVIGGYSLVAVGSAACAPTAGTSCLAIPLGIGMSVLSYNQAAEGNSTLFGNYQPTQGQRVLDSLNPATYPGDQNRAAELGVAGSTAALVAVGVGTAAKYVIKYASTVDAAIADTLGVGEGTVSTVPGFTATESKVIYKANIILRSSEVAKIEEVFNTGNPITVTIGGRLIQYEPSLPASGMTIVW